MKISVIIATLGRKPVVEALLNILARQTRRPDNVSIVIARAEDHPDTDDEAVRVDVVHAPRKGLCAQRNAGLDHIGDTVDLVVFFDDDFVPAPTYLEQLAALFTERPALVGATGDVLLDGIKGPGLTFDDALGAIDAHAPPDDAAARYEPRPGLYGCNMAYRCSAIGAMRFDERLPLYGWLEDADFSARVRAKGDMVWTNRLYGVHMGVKAGRTSGLKFGYSQLMNPVYLNRKGSMPASQAANNIMRNVLSNHARMFFPERHIDRLGRARGNWIAVMDLARGKVTPERITDL